MNPKSFTLVVRNSLLSELEYRFNYFMWLLSSSISVAMESAILLLALHDHEILGGFLRVDLWKFVVVGIVLRTTTGQWRVVGEAIDEVREGGFRKYLLQPIFYPAYFIARALGDKLTITLVFWIGMLVYKLFDWPSPFLSWPALPMFLVSFLVVNVLTWQIYLLMIFGAFWIDETQFLQIAFNIGMGIFSGTLVPYSWLPVPVKSVLVFTPFQLLGDWPIRSALGRMEWPEFFTLGGRAALWVLIFSGILGLMERKGLRRYEAFGG